MQKAESGGKIRNLKVGKKVGKKLLNNLGLKLMSIVLAVVLWFLVVISDNPKETRTFSNIPVILTNVELLENEGKVYEILDNSDRVRVSVEVPRSDLDKLRSSDIIAEADMKNLTAVNTIAINFSVMNDDVNVTNITGSRDVVRLHVEDKVSRWIDLGYELKGEVPENYKIMSTTIDQTRIEISGPESVIANIDHAMVEYDVTGAIKTQYVNVEPRLYNKDGEVLNYSNVSKSADHVQMTVQILAVKEVPLEVNYTGVPAEGYLTTGETSCQPSTVMIAGAASVLSGVNKISIPEEALDITGAEGTVTRSINIKEYLGRTQLAESSYSGWVEASVVIEPEVERTLVIPKENIRVLNMPEEFYWEFDADVDPCSVTISGLNAVVSAVQPNNIYGTVDIAAWMEEQEIKTLKDGSYQIPISVDPVDNVSMEEEIFVQIVVEEMKEDET